MCHVQRTSFAANRTPRLPAIVAVLTILGHSPAVIAQGPQRGQSVRVPGTDITLEAGWRLLWTADQRCLYAIPAAWMVSGGGRRAEPPDGTVTVSVVAIEAPDWPSHRRAIKRAMPAGTVREETSHRLWVERSEGSWQWQHVSVSEGTGGCSADIETHPGDWFPDVVRKIASSVRVAHDADRQWLTR